MLLQKKPYHHMAGDHHLLFGDRNAHIGKLFNIGLLALGRVICEEVKFSARLLHSGKKVLRKRKQFISKINRSVHIQDKSFDIF